MPGIRRKPAANEWSMPGANTGLTRFSELTDINSKNVATLRTAFTFSMGVNRGRKSAPLVIGTTLYVVSPYPNILYALDISKPGAPLKWSYQPHPLAASQGVACCDVVNRGAARRWQDGLQPARRTHRRGRRCDGKQFWRTQMGDINRGETITMAPIVVKGKVIVGYRAAARWACAAGSPRSTRRRARNLARVQYRPGHRHESRPALQTILRARSWQDLGITSWPGDSWKRAAARVGLGFVRSRSSISSITARQSRTVERRSTSGRQQVERRRSSRAMPIRAR